MGDKKDPIPSQSLTLTRAKQQPGESTRIKVDTTLTPRSSRKVLEQVGEITDLLPWLPWEMTRDMLEFGEDQKQNKTVIPEQTAANNSIPVFDEMRLIQLVSQVNDTDKEAIAAFYAQTSKVIKECRYNEAFTDSVTGQVTTYNITKRGVQVSKAI